MRAEATIATFAETIPCPTRVVASALLLVALGTGCNGASADPGLDALFRASGAQYVPGPLPQSDEAVGPKVRSVTSNNNRLYPGVQNKSISGTVESNSSAVAVGLAGDIGYWIVSSGTEDLTSPPDLTFSTRGSFSPWLSAGAHDLIFRAVDRQGVMGPTRAQTLRLDATPIAGAFVILLEWDTPADLDLHVVAPATASLLPEGETTEIWSKKRNSLAPRTPADAPYTDEEIAAQGTLDFDSNSGCAYDGRNNENVIWALPPPAGHYIVRVDAASLCGASTARWHAAAYYQGEKVAEAFGQMTDIDTTRPHVAGAGLTVLDLPVQ